MSEKSTVSSNQQSFINLSEMVEHEFCDQIDEEDFFELVDTFNIDFSDFLKKKTCINMENVKRFNQFILKCKTKLGINIYESLIFIEKNFVSFSKLINLLTDENKQILTREMADKYRIKIKRSALSEFLIY